MKDKKSFIAYCDWIELFEELSDERAGKLIKHLLAYVNDENPKLNDPMVKLAFISIKQSLKRDLQRWEGIRKSRSDAGKASAEARKQKATNPTSVESVKQKATNPTVSVTVNGNVNDNDNIYPFEDFWNLYDKKRGPKTKIENKWNKLSESTQAEIMSYIPRYIESQPDKQFRKDPSTFFNNESWKDEIIGKTKQKTGLILE